MHERQLVFSQITDHLPFQIFHKCVQSYQGERYVKRFRCLDQFLVANANVQRNWRIHSEFAQSLNKIARPLYAEEDLGIDFDNIVYALNAFTFELFLSLFQWALIRSSKSAV